MLKIKEDTSFEQLKNLGFKKDKRNNISYSITDELFGDVVIIHNDRKISFYEFSDGIRFKLMEKNLIEIV